MGGRRRAAPWGRGPGGLRGLHFLADEVGLGKTIQALAIIRATLISHPGARVVVVCPDELVRQWTVEALARAAMALDDGAPDADPRQPLLLWPKRLSAAPELAARIQGADLLVVDELPRLAQRRELCRALAAAPGALVLTANPPLADSEEGQRLLEAIEPRRTPSAAPWSAALAREAAEAAELTAAGGGPADWARAAARFGATRRVLRAARADGAVALPERDVRVRWVEPTEGERERQRLLWEWMRVAGDTSRDFDLVRLGQRVRSAPSVRQRVTFLIGHGHDRGGLLAALRDGLKPHGGDSRLEALIDELAELWAAAPEARVVVGANDNLTVDWLAELLPKIFDEAGPDGGPLQVASIRNQTDGPSDRVDPADAIAAAVSAFTTGDAKVMLLTDKGVAGLNLQVAQRVIIYACPWSLVEIDQLIGRVDRLRPRAELGAALAPVQVTVLAQRGLVDERIVEVVGATGVLARPLAAGEVSVDDVSRLVAAAGLTDAPAEWRAAARAAKLLSSPGAGAFEQLPLRPHQRDRGAAARAALDECMAAPALWPADPGLGRGPRAREAALWSWLKGLTAAGVYALGQAEEGSRRLGYRVSMHLGRAAHELVPFALDPMPRGHSRAKFWLRRDARAASGALASEVEPIELLEHGGALHDALLRAFLPRGRARLPATEVFALRGGRYWSLRGAQLYLAAAAAHAPVIPFGAGEHATAAEAAGAQADQRWLDGRVGGALLATGFVVRDGAQRALRAEELADILRPDPTTDVREWRSSEAAAPSAGATGAARLTEAALQAEWRRWWDTRLPDLRQAVEDRVALIDGERADLASRIAAERVEGRASARSLGALEQQLASLTLEASARAARLRAAVSEPPPLATSVSMCLIVQ